MTESEIAYLAGIVDGEGCIMINRFKCARTIHGYQYRVIMEITMCEGDTIKYLASVFDRPIETRTLKSGKTAYKIIWRNQPAANVLTLILPYLRGKRAQAVACLEFQKLTPGRGHDYSDVDIHEIEKIRLHVRWLKTAEALRC